MVAFEAGWICAAGTDPELGEDKAPVIKQQASTPSGRFVRVGARAYFETKLGWFAVEGVNLIRDLPAF